jgi:uncharacterized NAD(P)/FAD-binding protein YdhS
MSTARASRVVIVGGGFTGAAAAVQLVRASAGPIAITIVEPREELGRGLAYSTPDPDHRINGNTDSHVVDLADAGELNRWCEAKGILERDPAARSRNGHTFIRRHDFGSYVRDTVAAHAACGNGSTIRHLRDTAIDAMLGDGGVNVLTRGGRSLQADLAILATGNAPARLPSALPASLAAHPHVIVDPADLPRLRAIPLDARVLLLGTGLTALDVASTLVRAGHHGGVLAISRRGLRPRLVRLDGPSAGPTLLERIEGPIPAFVREAPLTCRGLLRALRQRVEEAERDGGEWYAPFDAMRDVVRQFWPHMPAVEKRRFNRQLRTWYDTHRFRAPPQNDEMVRKAERASRVSFAAARLRDVRALGDRLEVRLAHRTGVECLERFDYLVNCTGLDPAAGARENPLLAALMEQGLLSPDASGIGFGVDDCCRPLGRDGAPQLRMRMFGPPTAGTFGDPLGVLFIAPQIRRAVPGMLAVLLGAV